MQTPQLLTDIANVMMLLAPSAALLCLVLAGISLRQKWVNFAIGGGFTKWMFWAVIFVTLPGLLIWFSNSGVSVPSLGGGISSAWLSSFETERVRLRSELRRGSHGLGPGCVYGATGDSGRGGR